MSIKQELAKYSLLAKPSPLPVSINSGFFWDTDKSICLCIVYGYIHGTTAEMSSGD
jgi:hypothetical protein